MYLNHTSGNLTICTYTAQVYIAHPSLIWLSKVLASWHVQVDSERRLGGLREWC